MNNCLVTKLKGSVNNDYLSKLGEFAFEVNVPDGASANESYASFIGSSNIDIRTNGTLVYTPTSYDVSNSRDGHVSGHGRMFIKAPYASLRNFHISAANNVDLDSLGYFIGNKLGTELYLGNSPKGSLEGLFRNVSSNSTFKRMYATDFSNITGDISVLTKFSGLIRVDSMSSITGNIETLSNNLNLLEIRSVLKCTGDVKVLFDNMAAAGRTSGTLDVYPGPNNVNITYDGQSKLLWAKATFTENGYTDNHNFNP